MKLRFSASIFLLVFSLGLLLDYDRDNSTTESKIELSQPPALVITPDSSFILQPIVDNLEIPKYEFIMAFKLYYQDKMAKPIEFRKGEPLKTYCSDSTIVTFYLTNQDSVKIGSIKRMSCKILAIFNLSKRQNSLLRDYPMDSIKVQNYVTENTYVLPIKDKQYLNRWINKYNNWR